jgi:hypothetical protein
MPSVNMQQAKSSLSRLVEAIEQGLFLRDARLGQGSDLGANFFIEAVADAFVEQQRENVAAKFGMIGVAAQNIGRRVEIAFQFSLCHPARGTDDDGGFEGAEEFFEVHCVVFT